MDKDLYIKFANTERDLPVFMQPWWLNAVCEDVSWDAIVVSDEEENVRGAWAFARTRLSGFDAIVLPPLTQFTGIWLNIDQSLPHHKQEVQRQDILAALEKKLPKTPILELKLHWPLQDWAPFYWAGYKQETRYTFRFPEPDTDLILNSVSKSFRRNYRSASRKFTIRLSEDLDEFQQLIEKVFDIRDDRMPFDKNTVLSAYRALKEKEQCAIYCADSAEGSARAAIMTIWDNTTTYYILGGRVSSNTQNATNLLLIRAIADAAERGHAFDFEGSMIEGVHKFFQSFGAQMQPYLYLYRYTGLAKAKYFR